MGLTTSGRTWDEAASPAALRLARRFEDAWRAAAAGSGRRPALDAYLAEADADSCPGARLALLRAEMTLMWEAGDRSGVAACRARFPDLTGETLVALIYEEFCLREEAGESPDPAEYFDRYSDVSDALRRVLDIHGLVGSAAGASFPPSGASALAPFPKAGETTAGFRLVEELGRGAFARVFLAEERQLADRAVALKVARVGTREPQTLARLQHTHIVPVYSYRTDPATGLHLLCMPYFGRVTLARLLADPKVRVARGGADLVEALDRLGASEPPAGGSTARKALARRPYAQALAWWGARLADGLGHAHDRGVLHRDVKPSNVLVTRDGMPMLLDFNLAREAVFDAEDADQALPGGTLDYMAPEQIDELAEGRGGGVDARADVFGLGVVLYEAMAGERPFETARGGASAADLLRDAAAARRDGPPRLRATRPEVPSSLEAVVRRCLEPDPADRYATAADLAADLQAVADDRPLRFAREPLGDRAFRWARRNARVLAAVVPVVLALAVISALLVRDQLGRSRLRTEVQELLDAGDASAGAGDYDRAVVQYAAAARLADQPRLRRELGALRRQAAPAALARLGLGPSLDDLRSAASGRYELAERTRGVRTAAAALSKAADPLRFRLTGFGGDLRAASLELFKVLAPFAVLEEGDWLARADVALLDPPALARLTREVNELLFLWAVALDRSAERATKNRDAAAASDARARGIEVCDRALKFAAAAGPWKALRAWFLDGPGGATPADSFDEPTALGCFQWGTLRSRQERRGEAIVWFRKAVRAEPGNYWYQFYLAFAYDEPSPASNPVEALRHYDVAVALEPASPWVRFSRARLYRTRGVWNPAMDDFRLALDEFARLPESGRDAAFERQVRLELGLLRQSLGDLAGARAEYDRVVASGASSDYARAARLNLAKIDADSGATARALSEYDALLVEKPTDREARLGRALLTIRTGKADLADADLTSLIDAEPTDAGRAEVLALRALARLAEGRPLEALADADAAAGVRPGLVLDRVRTRALIALGRTADLNLSRPEDLASLPLNGRPLHDDLRRLADVLRRSTGPRGRSGAKPEPAELHDRLTLAAVLSGLGDHAGATAEADLAVALAPLSSRVYLSRARVLRMAGRTREARRDVERARSIEPDDPRVWELRGRLRTEAGDPAGGLEDFDRAVGLGEEGTVRGLRAEALMAVGSFSRALNDWSLALAHDPEAAHAYLGRARAFLRLRQWDQALADLEQAAAWSQGRPALGFRVAFAYAQCVKERPKQLPRLFALLGRAWGGWCFEV